MWEIYSIGDSAFLAAVLNSVAMIAGTGAIGQLAGIGFLLAILLTAFQGLMAENGPRFPYQHVFVAAVVYMLMYGPQARVAIEDAYSGAVRVVDNVPFGVAATGSVVSAIGYRLTVLFEQAFATPKMTEEGFTSALALLLDTRKATFGRANSLQASDDLEKTLVNYIRDCTLVGVDLGLVQESAILTAANTLTALRFDSTLYGTVTRLPGDPAIGAERDCTAAFTRISQHVNDAAFLTAWETQLAGLLGTNPFNRAQQALDAIVGIGHDARTTLFNTVLMGIYLEGVRAKHNVDGDVAAALITESAIAQRQVQWAAEETLFQRAVRPLLTAIEGLVYAVSPLMAFLIVLGSMGIRMAGRYLLLAFWIQLWMPVMAIIHLYTNMVATHGMEALAFIQGIDPTSQLGLAEAYARFADWLATAGMLASSVPAISLMLVYGSSITATHLASRLQSGDYINEKIAAPDVLEPAPFVQLQPQYTSNPTRGTYQTGAEDVLPTFNLGRDASASLTDNASELTQATLTYGNVLASGVSQAFSRHRESFDGHALNRDLATSQSAVDKYLYSKSQSALQSVSAQHISQESTTGSLGGNVNVSPGQLIQALQMSGNNLAGLSATLQNAFGVSKAQSDQIQQSFSREVSGQTGLDAALSSSVRSDVATGTRTALADRLDTEDQSKLEQAASDLASKSREYQESSAFSDRLQTVGAIWSGAAGARIATHSPLMTQLEQTLDTLGLTQAAQRLAGPTGVYGQLLPDRQQAFAAAGLALLLGYAEPGRLLHPIDEGVARDAGLQLLAESVDGPRLAFTRAGVNQGAADTVTPGAATRPVIAAGLVDPRPLAAGLKGSVPQHYAGTESTLAGGEREVTQRYAAGQQRVTQARNAAAAAESAQALEQARQQLRSTTDETRPAGRVIVEEFGGFLGRAVQGISSVGSTLGAGAAALVTTFERERAQGAGFWDALSRAVQAVPEGADAVVQGWYQDRLDHARRMGETSGLSLTEAQTKLYASASLQALVGLEDMAPGIGDAVQKFLAGPMDRQADIQAVKHELPGDPDAQRVVDAIERAARTGNDDYLRQIGNFNRALDNSRQFWQDGSAVTTPGATGFQTYLGRLEQERGLPSGVLWAIARAESGEKMPDPNAISNKGAQGMFQLMPDTARRFGVGNPFNSWEAARGAADYLRWLYDRYDGNLQLALAGYNAGEKNVDTYGGIPPFKETQGYVPRVIRLMRG